MQLKVKIKRVCYSKPSETGGAWYILSTDKGGCKGSIGWEVKEDDVLVLDGDYKSYKGQREFSFRSAMPDIPVNPRDQLHYCCERTKGIGPSMEQAIWDEYGEKWQEIKPNTIPKMNEVKYEAFKLSIESLSNDAEKVQLLSYLMGKGASMIMATSAYEKWGKKTMGIINADCYKLADLPNHGFGDVDRTIRENFGIALDDPRRVKAAVDYGMKIQTTNGSTVATWDSLCMTAVNATGGMKPQLICDCVMEMFKEQRLKAFHSTGMIARAIDHSNEQIIWSFIKCG